MWKPHPLFYSLKVLVHESFWNPRDKTSIIALSLPKNINYLCVRSIYVYTERLIYNWITLASGQTFRTGMILTHVWLWIRAYPILGLCTSIVSQCRYRTFVTNATEKDFTYIRCIAAGYVFFILKHIIFRWLWPLICRNPYQIAIFKIDIYP
jgi:hypothetical protein